MYSSQSTPALVYHYQGFLNVCHFTFFGLRVLIVGSITNLDTLCHVTGFTCLVNEMYIMLIKATIYG